MTLAEIREKLRQLADDLFEADELDCTHATDALAILRELDEYMCEQVNFPDRTRS